MSYRLKFEDRAMQEYLTACEFYEQQSEGLGDRFMDQVEMQIDYIIQHPLHFTKIKNDIRQALVHGFPYLIVYDVIGKNITVYSIFHTSRNPGKKFKK